MNIQIIEMNIMFQGFGFNHKYHDKEDSWTRAHQIHFSQSEWQIDDSQLQKLILMVYHCYLQFWPMISDIKLLTPANCNQHMHINQFDFKSCDFFSKKHEVTFKQHVILLGRGKDKNTMSHWRGCWSNRFIHKLRHAIIKKFTPPHLVVPPS